MEDFFRPKIIWKRVGSIIRFSYDDTGLITLDSTCIATGCNLKYLVAVLNSKMGKYLLKNSPKTGTGDLLISVQAIEPLYIPKPDIDIEKKISLLVDEIITLSDRDISNIELEINTMIYSLYQLTTEEIEFIEEQSVD